MTFDPTSSGTPTPTTIDNTYTLCEVAWLSVSQCTAVGGVGEPYEEDFERTFAAGSPASSTSTVLVNRGGLGPVVCSSVALCDRSGSQGDEGRYELQGVMRNVGALIAIGASPAMLAGTSYNMDCVTNGMAVSCMGGNKSCVTFPLQATQNY